MSLATSAAPVAVRRPATAQLLLPAAGARGTLPDTAAGKVCDPGVHAARVGLEQRALGGGCLREHLAGDRAKPEQAGPAVLLESHPAEQLRQLPGGEPPREVHLEIAVLRVHETAGVREVCAVGVL